MERARRALGVAACVLLVAASGCSQRYYRIRDTGNADNAYYTTKYKTHRDGTISFTDARSDARVTLQSSAVQRISREEWNGAVKE